MHGLHAFSRPSGDEAAEPVAWQIAGYLLITVASGAFLLLGWWILQGDPQPGWYSDSLFYLILADFYSGHASGELTRLSTDFYATSRFPPLFPITLALGGAGTSNWTPAYHVVVAFGLLALLTTFLWLRQQTGRAFAAAALLPIAILSPQYFYLHLEIISESQFLFILACVLLLVGLFEQRKCSVFTVAAVASLLPLCRTAGLVLLVAMSLWLAIKQRSLPARTKLLAGALLWLPAVVWTLYRRTYPVWLDYTGEISTPWSVGLGRWILDTFQQMPRLIEGYVNWFDPSGQPFAYAITVVILALATVGWYRRIKAMYLDGFFLPLYVGLIAIWPYPVETPRLLSITMPMIALHAWLGMSALAGMTRRRMSARAVGRLAALGMLFCALLGSGVRWLDIATRASAQLDPELAAAMRTPSYFAAPRHLAAPAAENVTRFVEMSKALVEIVEEQDCVWTPFYAVTAFFSSFKVKLYSTPVNIDSVDTAKAKLAACRYILVANLLSPHLEYETRYPAAYLTWAKPRLVSKMRDEHGGSIAAALLDLRP